MAKKINKNEPVFTNGDWFFDLTVGDVKPVMERHGKRCLCICGYVLPQYSGWNYKGINRENKHVFSKMSKL